MAKIKKNRISVPSGPRGKTGKMTENSILIAINTFTIFTREIPYWQHLPICFDFVEYLMIYRI